MTNSIKELEDAKLIFVIGSNTTEAHPVISYYIKRAVKRGATLIVSDPRKIDLTKWATMYVRIKPGTDVAYMNGLMREIIANNWHDKTFIEDHTEGFEELKKVVDAYTLERTSEMAGVPVETLKKVARLLGEADVASLVYTLGITEHVCGVDNVKSTANLQMVLGNMGKRSGGVNPLRGQNNVQGACDMGALPNVYPGYQQVTDPKSQEKFQKAWGVDKLDDKVGLMIPAMFDGAADGSVKCLYIYGENVVLTEPNMAHTKKCLEACEFVVVGEIFHNETTPYADVIFPDYAWGEEEGTFTNSERRLQRVRGPLKAPGEAKSHWWVLQELAKRMGGNMGDWQSSHDIWEEIRSLTPSMAGISWPRIEEVGLQWPCPTEEHPGTSFLHKDGNFTRGKGKFHAIEWRAPAEIPDEEYPFYLSTGRRLWHYHTIQTQHSEKVTDLCGEEWMEVHPDDAARLGINNGDWVRAWSRRGEITLRAWVTERSAVGVCWCSFHFAAACGNVLTNNAFDPISQTAEYKVCAINIEKVKDGEPMGSNQVARRQARP